MIDKNPDPGSELDKGQRRRRPVYSMSEAQLTPAVLHSHRLKFGKVVSIAAGFETSKVNSKELA